MLTPQQITALRDKAGQVTDPIVEHLIGDIAERVSEAGQITSTAAYQAWTAQKFGVSQKELKKELKKRLNLTSNEVDQLFKQAAETGYINDIQRLGENGAVSFEENTSLQQILDAAVKQARDDLSNMTQTMGFVGPDGKFRELTDAYQHSCDFAFGKVVNGAQDYQSAIRDATRGLAEKGIRVLDYASGTHRSIEAAARQNIMGGLGIMVEQITQQNHDDLGCDGWEISAHGGSAPDHEPYQGKQYSDKEYTKLNNSLVRPIGTLNCGHSAMPIILGVNEPQYTKAELEEFRQQNEAGVTYNGKHYTLYEATQRQRNLETAIRNRKRRIFIDEKLGDKDKLQTDQIRLQLLKQEYSRFSKATNLPMQHARMEAAGFGYKQANTAAKASKIAGIQKETLANRANNAIMNSTEMYSKTDDARKDFKFISDERFDALTVEARKKGAVIIRGTPAVERHLEDRGASAATVGDVLMFKKDVCVSEVIEEMHHLNQNLTGLNDDKGEPLRTILNEIDAKEHVIRVAQKYQVPRNELEHIKKQLDGYKQQLEDYKKGG